MSAAASSRIPFSAYLAHVGLPAELASLVPAASLPLAQQWSAPVAAADFAEVDLDALLKYRVPKLTGGACSRKLEYEDAPFDLGAFLGVPSAVAAARQHAEVARIHRLDAAVAAWHAQTGCDWFGVYHVRRLPAADQSAAANDGAAASPSFGLVKEAYRGLASRAIFPLTAAFALQSNNSHVGLHASARLIPDLDAYEGAYYECDAKVKSELCVPIIDLRGAALDTAAPVGSSDRQSDDDSHGAFITSPATGVDRPAVRVRGIIDAESFTPNFFTPEIIARVAHAAYELGFVY